MTFEPTPQQWLAIEGIAHYRYLKALNGGIPPPEFGLEVDPSMTSFPWAISNPRVDTVALFQDAYQRVLDRIRNEPPSSGQFFHITYPG